ncbi:MAG: MOSC domain-containing protein [Pseudomonadales bacterium]|nr:MOSC domain-containing protein [Pseudomonadales bacterium]
MRSQQRLFARYIENLPPGQLSWIGVRPARKAPMQSLHDTQAIKDLGLEGDHRCTKTPGSARQVTIISEEYIQQIRHFAKLDAIHPNQLRRNLVVSNINLTALRHQQFCIGDAIFEATALCHPCSRMEQTLGKGAVAAMLGHGGLCAKVISSGKISVGDTVSVIAPQTSLF